MEQEEKYSIVFFVVGLLVAGVLLLYFFAASQRRVVYDAGVKVPSTVAKPVKVPELKLSISTSTQENGWTLYEDGAVAEIYVEDPSIQSVKVYYEPYGAQKDIPSRKLLGEATSLSSRQYVWAIQLPKDMLATYLWAEGSLANDGTFTSNTLEQVGYSELRRNLVTNRDGTKTYTNGLYGITLTVPGSFQVVDYERTIVLKRNTPEWERSKGIFIDLACSYAVGFDSEGYESKTGNYSIGGKSIVKSEVVKREAGTTIRVFESYLLSYPQPVSLKGGGMCDTVGVYRVDPVVLSESDSVVQSIVSSIKLTK